MTEAVRGLYRRNRQQGVASWCGLRYDFVCPSMGTYPFQWFWDSCFHTIVLAHFDRERARQEIRSLLANAQPDGFVGHVTFWQRERFETLLATYSIAYRTPYLSDCIQPPVLAEAVAAAAEGPGGDAFLAEVLPRVRRYYEWLDANRDPDRDGLIATLQPCAAMSGERAPQHEPLERERLRLRNARPRHAVALAPLVPLPPMVGSQHVHAVGPQHALHFSPDAPASPPPAAAARQ